MALLKTDKAFFFLDSLHPNKRNSQQVKKERTEISKMRDILLLLLLLVMMLVFFFLSIPIYGVFTI